MIHRWYFAGAGEIPLWVMVLEAAGDDPLRAQEMEGQLSQLWWDRWMVNRRFRAEAQERERKRQANGS